jgi:Ran GTPase-activating protein (RanGAP) involved in mRNA processing and transport
MSSWASLYTECCNAAGVIPRDDIAALADPNTITLNGNCSERFSRRVDDTEFAALCTAIGRSMSVVALDVSYNHITSKGIAVLADLLRTNATLQTLQLGHNNIDAEGARALADALMLNMTVLSLTLSGNPVDDEGGIALGTMLRGNNTLNELHVASCYLGTKAVLSIVQAAQTHPSLSSLYLDKPLIKGPHDIQSVMQHLASTLKETRTLVDLSLNFFELADDSLAYILPALVHNTSLLRLSLRGNKLSPGAGELIATFLARRPELIAVDLTANRLGDVGACAIAGSLRTHPSIRQLLLGSNAIGEVGLIEIADALVECTSISEMTLWGNRFSDDATSAFYQYRDQLEALHLDFEFYVVDGVVMLAQK